MAGKKGEDRSYFAVKRRQRKRYVMIIIPIVVAVAITLVVLAFMSGPALPSSKMVLHNHATLKVISNNGVVMTVPAHIGMVQVGKAEDPLLFADHSLDKYGMQGMSPLHTHDDKGTIHVESNTVRDYTLGEFLDIWRGLDSDKIIQATVNGNPVSDFRNVILNDGAKINLEIKS